MKRKFLCIVLVVAMSICGCVLSGCGETPSTPSTPTTRSNPELVLSSSVSRNNVTITLRFNSTDAVNICGYQLAVNYDTTAFTFNKAESRQNGFEVYSGDTNGVLRIMGVPNSANKVIPVKSQSSADMLRLSFTANAAVNDARFSIEKNVFEPMVCVYQGSEPTAISGVVIKDPIVVSVK